MHAVPGGPLMVLLPKGASQQAILEQEKNAGLLDPVPIQYLHWLGQLLHDPLLFQ